MKFEAVIESIATFHALRRIASAHVVDYARLGADELRANILRTLKQYTHPDAVKGALDEALYVDSDLNHRVLADLIIVDVLLNEYGHLMPTEELEEKVLQCEQGILDESNEKDLKGLAGGREDTEQFKSLSLYYFVLQTAWEHRDTKSVDEANLLRKLRAKLGVTDREHRILEAMLGKYPKDHNELHSRTEINDSMRKLETLGIVFEVRDDDGVDFAVIPEEIVMVVKELMGIEIRRPGYLQLLQYKYVRKRSYLKDTLSKSNLSYSANDTLASLQQRVADTVRPSVLLGGHSPKDGLSNETLHKWCSELDLPMGGTKADRIQRIIDHYNQLELRPREELDSRQVWYRFYVELASRDWETLRAQHVIEKDIDIERHFEAATSYLFDAKLNHTPLRQAGTEHSDGMLSFRDTYIMWDNKSSETPVDLKGHIKQFDAYMNKSDKPVPIFLVIGPAFTHESEATALQYTAENIGRNIALVWAEDLKELAELWASEENRRNSEPFPLGLFARPGPFSLDSIRSSLR